MTAKGNKHGVLHLARKQRLLHVDQGITIDLAIRSARPLRTRGWHGNPGGREFGGRPADPWHCAPAAPGTDEGVVPRHVCRLLDQRPGTELFVAYPVKAVTNPVFYLKIIGVVLAFLCLRRIRRDVFVDGIRVDAGSVGRSGRILAGALLFIWLATITAGRLMAYHDVGNVERDTVIAVFIVTAAMVLAWYAATRRWGRSLELGAEHTSRSHVASRR